MSRKNRSQFQPQNGILHALPQQQREVQVIQQMMPFNDMQIIGFMAAHTGLADPKAAVRLAEDILEEAIMGHAAFLERVGARKKKAAEAAVAAELGSQEGGTPVLHAGD